MNKTASKSTTRKGRSPAPGRKVRGSSSGRPIMAVLDLLSRRWALRVLWELRDGSLSFRALQQACGGLSPTLINTRLKELREAQLVELTTEGYRLTSLGRQLYSSLAPLQAWSETWARSLAQLAKRGRARAQ